MFDPATTKDGERWPFNNKKHGYICRAGSSDLPSLNHQNQQGTSDIGSPTNSGDNPI
jgi:hypothetical protein